jgi:hypothetical protein
MTKNKAQKKATIQGKVALLFSNIPYYNEFLKMICIGICVLVFCPQPQQMLLFYQLLPMDLKLP